ncbi:MAG: hypothetical protein PHY30_00280 [Candidatus Pacebacteria bacterium]|nr:hypothetical protein [Candidatus Paceibacterota bacterium]
MMKRRYTLILIICLFLIAIGLIIKFKNSNVIEEKDNITFFFELMEEGTGIDFSSISDSQMEWRVIDENNDVAIVKKLSKEALVQGISESDSQKIDDFFEDNGFELDVYNIADSPEGGLRGYRKNRMYCIVKDGYKISADDEAINVDVKIDCAL